MSGITPADRLQSTQPVAIVENRDWEGESPSGVSSVMARAAARGLLSRSDGARLASKMLGWLDHPDPRVSIAAGRVLAAIRLGDLRAEATAVQERQGDASLAQSALRLALSSPDGRAALGALASATSHPSTEQESSHNVGKLSRLTTTGRDANSSNVQDAPESTISGRSDPLPSESRSSATSDARGLKTNSDDSTGKSSTLNDSDGPNRPNLLTDVTLTSTVVTECPDSASAGTPGTQGSGASGQPRSLRRMAGGAFRRPAHPSR